MSEEQPKNPLHGVTLKLILEELVERHGWPELAQRIRIGCFANEPSMKSSLKFLRKTDWARAKVEGLYLSDLHDVQKRKQKNEYRARRRVRAEEAAQSKDKLQAEPEAKEPDPVE